MPGYRSTVVASYMCGGAVVLTAMASPSISLPDELLAEIDRERAEQAAKTGNVPSRSEWFRQAARQKLGIDYTDDEEAEKGAA